MNEEIEKVCWHCYSDNAHFAIILEIINELKRKKISSSFKNILERLHVGSEIPEISEDQLKEVLNFAEKNNYIDHKSYKGNISYKLNDNYQLGECITCGEQIEESFKITPSIDQNLNQNFNEYVDIKTFQTLLHEVNSL